MWEDRGATTNLTNRQYFALSFASHLSNSACCWETLLMSLSAIVLNVVVVGDTAIMTEWCICSQCKCNQPQFEKQKCCFITAWSSHCENTHVWLAVFKKVRLSFHGFRTDKRHLRLDLVKRDVWQFRPETSVIRLYSKVTLQGCL